MFKILIFALLTTIFFSFSFFNKSKTTYNKIAKNSKIQWRGTHLDTTHGHNGTLDISSAKIIVENNNIESAYFEVDMSSIDVNSNLSEDALSKLVQHLSSSDFFDVSNYSIAQFSLTKLEQENNEKYKVFGNLTILGIQQEIDFISTIKITKTKIEIKTSPFYIDRTKWGIDFSNENSEGIPKNYIISNKIRLIFNTSIKR